MATILPLIRLNRKNNETVPIQIRVTHKRTTCKINIGHRIKTNDWDDENKKVRKSHPNSVRLNNIIQNYISKIDNIILQTEYAGKKINFEDIKEKVFGKTNTQNTFTEYANKHLNQLLESKKFSQHGSSVAQVNKISAFYGEESTFSDITISSINKLRGVLKSKHKLSERSIVNHLIVIRQTKVDCLV
jgi:integrase/recombinase XerD